MMKSVSLSALAAVAVTLGCFIGSTVSVPVGLVTGAYIAYRNITA